MITWSLSLDGSSAVNSKSDCLLLASAIKLLNAVFASESTLVTVATALPNGFKVFKVVH